MTECSDVPTLEVCHYCQRQSKKISDLELKLSDWMGTVEYQSFKDYDKNIFDVVFDIIKYSWGPR